MEYKYKILIVDDEPGLLFSLKAYLEDEGYEVEGATSGEEALIILQKSIFDAVIIDVRLPGIDGNEVILEAKRSGNNVAFFIHTGSTDYQLPTSLKNMGFSEEDIFLKPLPDLNIITQILEKKLPKRKNEEK